MGRGCFLPCLRQQAPVPIWEHLTFAQYPVLVSMSRVMA